MHDVGRADLIGAGSPTEFGIAPVQMLDCPYKIRKVGAMDIWHESPTRRNFIVAGSAQALLVLKTSPTFGQSPSASPGQKTIEAVDQMIAKANFSRANELFQVFKGLWVAKLELSLAIVEE